MEEAFTSAPYQPQGSLYHISTGAYYLEAVDSLHRRIYRQKRRSDGEHAETDSAPASPDRTPQGGRG